MTKIPVTNKGEACEKGCRYCEAYTYKLQIGATEVEVKTGLFTCCNPYSDHYTHVFTKDHQICEEWD